MNNKNNCNMLVDVVYLHEIVFIVWFSSEKGESEQILM
jgi:hypothetical protein